MFSIIFGVSAVIFLHILVFYRNKPAALSSLAAFTFTLFVFLVLITLVERIKNLEFWEKYKKFFIRKNAPKITEEAEKTKEPEAARGGLVEIKKENVLQAGRESPSPEKRVYSCFYIAAFLGIAFWRLSLIFRVFPPAYADNSRLGIADAVLLLIFPCVAVLYLKMRKDGDSRETDSVSRDILTFFSYTSFVYAAVIAAAAVLKINILVILQWVYYAASAYLVVSLGLNILLSMLKGDVLDFNYSLFPKNLLTKNRASQFAETTAEWKISIKSLYTIRYALQILPALALALVFVLFLSTGIFVVQPHQQAAVYRFGKLDRDSVKDPGLHFKFPWPVDKVEIYDVRRAASMQIGYESSGTANFLWTQRHDIGEYMLLLGNGNEMAAINLKIIYVISDLYSYIKTFANAQAVLSAAAYNALMTRTINTTLDSFLNIDRNSLSASLMAELSAFCKSEELGFSVIQVVIENIHPPVDIADVYQKVVSASVDKTTEITRAQSYAQTRVIEAAKQGKFAVDGAIARQHDRTSDTQKEAAVFYAAADAYRISPGSYELTKTLEVYQKIISGHKVYVFSRGTENSMSKFIIGKVNTLNLPGANKGDGNE